LFRFTFVFFGFGEDKTDIILMGFDKAVLLLSDSGEVLAEAEAEKAEEAFRAKKFFLIEVRGLLGGLLPGLALDSLALESLSLSE
jgi:hypothetical protein